MLEDSSHCPLRGFDYFILGKHSVALAGMDDITMLGFLLV